MSNIIDKIQLSGVTYDIGGSGSVSTAITSGDTNAVAGGAVYDKFDEVEQVTAAALNELNDKVNPTVELTQAQYDALVTAGTVQQDTYYIITDATAVDMANYYTTAQTNSLLSGKQNTLVSGTNIKTINKESILGSGNISVEGKAIEAGRGISVTTGETADTVSFDLPISGGSGAYSIIESHTTNVASGQRSHAEGSQTSATSYYSHAEGFQTKAAGNSSHAEGGYNIANNACEHASGRYNVSSKANTTFGDSGNTLFSVGNGEDSEYRHNALDIRQNGDIYIVDTSASGDYYAKPMIKLQDHLGGGGTVSSAITSGDTNAVAGGAVYNRFDEVEQVTAQALNVLNDRLDEDEEVTAAALVSLNESLSGKQDTLSAGTNITIVDNVISAQGGGSTYTAGDGINITNDVISVTGKTNQSDFTAHTANTTVHVTAQDKTNWNAKSDFSGSYNDLTDKPTIPTVPTSNTAFTNDAGYLVANDISGKTDVSSFTAHTANTTVHITAAERTAWNAKSDFSGSYNDLTDKPTIPTVPTSNTAFTNDAGYITSSVLNGYATTGDVQTATNDMATKTWVGQQGYLTEHQSLTAYSTTEQVNTAISQATSGKADSSTVTALTSTVTAHTANTTVHVTSSDKSSWNGAATNASNAVTALGGLSLVKLTQTQYDNLQNKDSNTLYVIVN